MIYTDFIKKIKLIASKQTRFNTIFFLITCLVVATFDILISIYLSELISNKLFIQIFIILIARSGISLLNNLFYIRFALSAEIDLKCLAFRVEANKRDNFFKLISFNVSHMAIAGILRVISEILLLTILIIYLVTTNITYLKIILLGSFLLLLFSLIYFNLSKNIRKKAAFEQSIFLSNGSDLVALSDRMNEFQIYDFFKNRLINMSEKYYFTSLKSLFFAQSLKPLIEPLIFLFGIYIIHLNIISGASIYIFYRIASSSVVILNSIPMIDHYIKQFEYDFTNSTK